MQKSLWKVQEVLEGAWPFPAHDSTFNLSIRDVLVTVIIGVVLMILMRASSVLGNAYVLPLLALWLEPAVVAFPSNVVQSLVLRTPRFWHPFVVEPRLEVLRDNFHIVQSEALAILKATPGTPFASVSVHQARIGSDGWKVFPFSSYGTVNEVNCARAPQTWAMLRDIPSIRLAMYSVLDGHTRIPTHCGFLKNVLRVHVTLYTDTHDTTMKRYISVGGQQYSWKTGEIVAFDDTYPHFVENTLPGKRVVLFLDIDRPTGFSWTSMFQTVLGEFLRRSPSIRAHAALQEKHVAIK